ncbi:MAG TPA: peptide chain release factor N(5)-glutamine methyltransferase [Candidatus Babeliales bacterium]|nr:peptide chain release factor N(5)-glutamine methyltransferase [Candidatus Babeliales bacterium]
MPKIAIAKLIRDLIQQGLSEQVAWWLLEKLAQKTKLELILVAEISWSVLEQAQLDSWVAQIVQAAKPVQYILGDVNFLGLKILVEPPILIPRPETEEWCATVIKQLKAANKAISGIKILDLCAGTGCIGLALAQAVPDAQVYAVEINPQACELIEKNKLINQISNLAVINLDLNQLDFSAIGVNKFDCNNNSSDPRTTSSTGIFDIIVANPPYITELEYLELAPNVREWEDPKALVSGTDGLDLIRQIIELAARVEIKVLYLEIGYLQAELVITLAQVAGFKTIIVHRDMYGKNRMLEIRLA